MIALFVGYHSCSPAFFKPHSCQIAVAASIFYFLCFEISGSTELIIAAAVHTYRTVFAGGAQFVGIELYSKLKEYLESHLEQLRPVGTIKLF